MVKKLLPDEKAKNLYKYLAADKLTPGQFKKALEMIDQHAGTPSERLVLKDELLEVKRHLFKLYKDQVDNRVSLEGSLMELKEIFDAVAYKTSKTDKDGKIIKEDFDLRRAEMEKLLRIFEQLPQASYKARKYRRKVKRDPKTGKAIKGKDGKWIYEVKYNEDGSVKRKKNGEPYYEWEDVPNAKNQREKLITQAYQIVEKACIRALTDRTTEKIHKILDRTTPRKRPEGAAIECRHTGNSGEI